MPFVNTDWKDEVIPIVDATGAAVSTVGWSVEMHIRPAAGASPAILKISSAAATLLVGQATPSGATNGITPNVPKAGMAFAPGTYRWDIKRIDGGRDEWVIGGDGTFEQPITDVGLA